MKKLFFSLILWVFFTFPLIAQDQQQKHYWTFEECLDYAHKNNLQIQDSRLALEINEANLKQSKTDLLPSINAHWNTNYNVGRSINPFTNLFEEQPFLGQNLGLSTDLVLFSGFQKQNQIKKNQADALAGLENMEHQKNLITINVITAYTQILMNQEMVVNRELRLANTQEQVERTRRQVNAGAVAEADLFQVEAQAAQDKLELVRAKGQLALAKLNLKRMMQLPDDAIVEVQKPAKLEVPDYKSYPESFDMVYQHALTTQPSIRFSRYQAESAFKDYQIARGEYYPKVFLSAGLGTLYSSVAPSSIPRRGSPVEAVRPPIGMVGNDPSALVYALNPMPIATEHIDNTYGMQLRNNLNRFIGIGVRMPIFSGFRARNNVKVAKIMHERAEVNIKSAQNQLNQDVAEAYQEMENASNQFESAQNQEKAQRQAFINNQKRFEMGAINAIDFTRSKNELDIAESELIQSKYELIFRSKVLDFYAGNPISFEN
jgi:outer membrane protein